MRLRRFFRKTILDTGGCNEMAEIIKKSIRRYEVVAANSKQPFAYYKNFRDARLKRNMPMGKYEHCFGCGHAFDKDEQVYFGSVRPKGNILFCHDCANKYATDR
jgi:hypothetical protein